MVRIINKIKKRIPDQLFLKLQYRHHFGQQLNLDNPRTFNEKLQWLKLYDRKPEYVTYADKYAVRNYIENKIGKEYLIPLIGVYDSVDEINWEKLPEKFVLKCTHGSGSNIICKDKSELDIEEAKGKLNVWMNRNWYWYGREWPYKNVKPRIIAEKFMEDESGQNLKDYKIFCFNGEPKIIQVMSDRTQKGFDLNHFDTNWKELDIQRKSLNKSANSFNKPKKLNQMLKISEIISENMPFVRVDLYYINENIYFGEVTFYPVSGYMDFANSKDDYQLGSWLKLPN